jgi:squalene-hopene/tetraprenyl-beta-curcumene cyclase
MTLDTASVRAETDEALDGCLDRAIEYMRSIQHEDGYWWAELESNATMAAEHVMLEHVLGIAEPLRMRKLARYILGLQQDDGSWSIYFGGPGDVSITTEAYFALKLAGTPADAPEMARARSFVLAHGGAGATRIFTRIWLALFGQSDWDALPAMPPEVILLPDRFPINIYEFASWARATIVGILVVCAQQPTVRIAPDRGVGELYVRAEDRRQIAFKRDRSPITWRNAFLAVDRVLRVHERSPWKPLRRRALKACERWILDHQERDGSWGGIQPPWVYALIALKSLGYSNEHPVMAAGIRGLLEGFALETEETFTVQPCVSPVWDTALAVTGMREAGVPADDAGLLRAGRWLLSKEIRARGDWCVKVKDCAPGGWAFEFENDKYPDTDDTA